MRDPKWKKAIVGLIWFGVGFGCAVILQIPFTAKQRVAEVRRCLSEMYHMRHMMPHASIHTQEIIDGYIAAKEESLKGIADE